MGHRSLRLVVATAVWLSLGTSHVWACPMCKFAIEADDPKPSAYMYSILFMLVAITTVVGGLIAFLTWLSKYERTMMNAAGYQHLFENGVDQHALESAAK